VNILDTDALSHHMKRNAIGLAIEARMRASADPDFRITAIGAVEMVDGAIALHKSLKKRRKDLIPGFDLIQEVVEYLGEWRGRIHGYDAASDQIYRVLHRDSARSWGMTLGLRRSIWRTERRSGRATWTTSSEYRGSPSTGLRLTCGSSDEADYEALPGTRPTSEKRRRFQEALILPRRACCS
jgi:hypothetical protein